MSNESIDYRFGKKTTAQEVLADIDLSDHLVVLTGATSGIGVATAEALVAAGAELVIGARNEQKLDHLLAKLHGINASATLHGFPLDLMSIHSVDAFADSVLDLGRLVDILINNAGITGQLRRNSAGMESQLMTNFIGHAVLTSRLSEALQQADGARVVSLTSFGHHYSPVVFNDLNFENRPYTAWDGYGQSKTACVLLAVQVSSVLGARGVDAFAVHPGAITTQLGDDLNAEDFALAEKRGSIPGPDDWKTPEQGAATSVWAATEPQLAGLGPLYLEDCRIAETLEVPNHRSGVMSYAMSPENAGKLWSATEKLIDRTLPLKSG